MGHRAGQFNVAHALPAHLGQGHFHTTFLADHAAVLEALVLTTQALIVVDRSEYLGAEQTFPFRLEGTVVDGLGLLHLAKGPGPDHVR